jgi:hypothetical protein
VVLLVAVTLSDTVYPTLLIFTILLGVTFIPVLLNTYWLDYITPET